MRAAENLGALHFASGTGPERPVRARDERVSNRLPAQPGCRVLWTVPSFITKATWRTVVMSVRGSPGTPTMSASIPGAMLVSYAVNIFHQPKIPDSGAAFFDCVVEPAV